MSNISQGSFIDKICNKILQPKQTSYSQQPIYMTLTYLDHHQSINSIVYNKYNQKLKTTLFIDKQTNHQICIVYMHGYGSNRTQAIHIMKCLPANISMCCFDFSGEGKSEGKIITFGQKQKDDVRAILQYLRTTGYKQFILWGRSMGATCTLLFTLKQKPKDVVLQILDSPFISFESAAVQLTSKMLSVPEFIISLALDALKKNLASKQFNPFQVNLNQPIYTDIPTLFLYSEEDQIINHKNSQDIIKNFVGFFEKMIIPESHNQTRKQETIKKIIDIIGKYLIKKVLKKPQSSKKISTNNSSLNKTSYFDSDKTILFENYGIRVSSKQSRDFAKAQQNARITMPSTPKRPRSSMKVYSKQEKQKKFILGNFQVETNFPKTVKNEKRVGLSRPKKNQFILSNSIYL